MIWCLRSGESVRDRDDSHLHGDVVRYLPEVLAATNSRGQASIVREHRFPRVVGVKNVVQTNQSDSILFAQRPGRAGLSRFVLNRRPEPTNWVTVILRQQPTGEYMIVSAWCGPATTHEPWDKYATLSVSRRFWSTHAIVWGTEPADEETITTTCPW